MKDFETAYRQWIDFHMSNRRGERLRMLKEQHGHAEKLLVEKIWWPVVGSFEFLHPQYEVVDEEGNYYYLDLAYIRLPKPTNLECDGFNPHARDADRHSFRKSRRRQNALMLNGWNVIRFSADDIKEDPAYCRRTLKRMLERWYGEEREDWSSLPLHKREIMRLAIGSTKPVRVSDVATSLGSGEAFARRLLRELVDEGWLQPASGTQRIHQYQVAARKFGAPY